MKLIKAPDGFFVVYCNTLCKLYIVWQSDCMRILASILRVGIAVQQGQPVAKSPVFPVNAKNALA
ncbi:hypothetical protein PQU96_09160 [Vogesella sp. LYT5W]|uniref:Uncharacterized protein n=1 Tax=Vogesella margarita TaxID=2984199 RepID=A0ABT5IP03_9NEIS|nr:hypothetical protein [Vogesella margarita]MDC7714294.1 hypothetical protein [Vogesella margarita]